MTTEITLADGQVWRQRSGATVKLKQVATFEGMLYKAGDNCYDNKPGGKNVFGANIECSQDLVKFVRNEGVWK